MADWRGTRSRRGMWSGVGIGALLIAAAIALTLAPRWGEVAAERSDPRKPVEVWSWNIAAMALDRLVPSFERIHPDVRVHVNRNGTNMESRLLLSLAANVGAPDISQLQGEETPKFRPSGKLLDITPWAQKYAADFPAACWQNCVHDGRIYAIPWDQGPCAVFYKRWLFKANGIDPATIETWDDYIAAGKQLLERTDGRTQLMTIAPADLFQFFVMLTQQNGGGLFDAQERIALNTPQNREALALIRKMLDANIAAPIKTFSPEYLASFSSDAVASYPIAVWMMPNIKDGDAAHAGEWGVFRMPAYHPGGLHTSDMGGSTLVIPARKAAHPKEAFAFIEHSLCTVDGQIDQFKNFSLFPAYLPALKDPYLDQPYPFFGGQRVNRLFATDIDKIPPLIRT